MFWYPIAACRPSSNLHPEEPHNSGDISWHKDRVFISDVFRFELLGFEQLDFYKVYFRDVEIDEFDAEALRFRSAQVRR